MATTTIIIRDYEVKFTDGNSFVSVSLDAVKTKNSYCKIPTPEEVYAEFGVTEMQFERIFYATTSMIMSPILPNTTTILYAAYKESSIVYPPVIPLSTTSVAETFYDATNLKYIPSIPSGVGALYKTFKNTYGGGEAVIRPTSLYSYTECFSGTTGDITLYGDKTLCQGIASTAENGNVTWSDWYDPITAVTNRGEGSRTTATDFERMVKNGVLAVSTYAPARMNFTNTDIVHEDEWIALCDAAKTIDNTITYSTHYANLNKIEAAFDSAL